MFRNSQRSQRGNLYIVVIFVLVVMGFLATSLGRIEWSNRDAHTRDVLGTQAWLLSHSINEVAMTLFYPLDSQDSAIAQRCADTDTLIQDQAELLLNTVPSCRLAEISCENRGSLDGAQFYILESAVTCGSGVSEVRRSQQIWVKE